MTFHRSTESKCSMASLWLQILSQTFPIACVICLILHTYIHIAYIPFGDSMKYEKIDPRVWWMI